MSFKIENHREVTQIETREDSALGIMRWGRLNAFPQTLVNLVEQSPAAKTAVVRTARFLRGMTFEGGDAIINSQGNTLSQLVSVMAKDYALFEAFAVHANYNLHSKVSSLIPMRIPTLRFNQFDELLYASKIGYHEDFGRNSNVKRTITKAATKAEIKWIHKFNPTADIIEKQIEKAGSIKKYLGQMLYYSETGGSSYPIPPLQSVINYVLADIENSILMRKETSTGFINSYLLKTMMSAEDPNLDALEAAIEDAQGARGSGKVITMSDLSPDEVNATLLEEIGRGTAGANDIVNSVTKAYELNQKVINNIYLIPPVLGGGDQKVGFSSADLVEAYAVFNAQTQHGREVIQNEVNRLLKYSDFSVKEIKLVPITLGRTNNNGNGKKDPLTQEEEISAN